MWHSKINWIESGGADKIHASGICYDSAPVHILDKEIRFHRLSVCATDGFGDSTVSGIEREWISTEGSDYIEIRRGVGSSTRTHPSSVKRTVPARRCSVNDRKQQSMKGRIDDY